MSLYTIEDTTLTSLGDAVRSKTSKYIGVDEMPTPTFDISFDTTTMEPVETYIGQTYHEVPLNLKEMFGEDYSRIAKLYVSGSYESYTRGFDYSIFNLRLRFRDTKTESSSGVFIDIVEGNSSDPLTGDITTYVDFANIGDNRNKPYISIQLKVNDWVYTNNDGWYKCNLQIWACDANDKFLKLNTYTPLEMVDEINGLMTIPDEALTITGDCQYRFAYGGNDWLINMAGDKITTKDISNANYMFANSDGLTAIPFEINLKSNANINDMFSRCELMREFPQVNITTTTHLKLEGMFSYCHCMREIPEWFIDLLEEQYNLTAANSTFGKWNGLFRYCYSLRKIPERAMRAICNPKPSGNYYGIAYCKPFSSCRVLDELESIACDNCILTSNQFSTFFLSLSRVKNITFETNEDGTPVVRQWKSQTIDFSGYVGYASETSYILSYNSGITADKQVSDDATYQALKDDPDYFTLDINYSRYNRTSAVNTINSLPDTSAYGTNTIKFQGAAGALTDGGAINTMTEEEIAVATAKGWTVSLV